MRPLPSILLVEDNADDADLAQLAFEQIDLAVSLDVARDGPAALSRLHPLAGCANPPPLPSLVLLDLSLPLLDGFAVLGALRKHVRTRYLPVVILSSSTEERDIVRCYQLGANGYVRKPIDFDEFLRVAANLAEYWLGSNVSPASKTEGHPEA